MKCLRLTALFGAIFAVTSVCQVASAQVTAINNVGGIEIDSAGLLGNTQPGQLAELKAAREKALNPAGGDLKAFNPLRKVSLRGLEAALAKVHSGESKSLPPEIAFMAGLQRIDYVFAVPETNDVVLAGPAEGWRIDGHGTVVGLTTGRPVLLLDDFLVALRSAADARNGGIRCSIDPTAEGIQQLRSLVSKLKTIGNPAETLAAIEQALGPQVITVGGVPESSHFGVVLVAADYRMKRLAMNLEQSPIAGMKSFLEASQAGSSRGMGNMLPRWWLAPQGAPVFTDAAKQSWQIPQFPVKCFTEQDFVTNTGDRSASGKADKLAQNWADSFTKNYPKLAQELPIFAELENVINLAVVTALIDREELLTKANLPTDHLIKSEAVMEVAAPKRVSTQASLMKKNKNYVISASGGVQMHPSQLIESSEAKETVDTARTEALAKKSADSWWWN